MQTLKTFSRAIIAPQFKKDIENNLGIIISKNSRGYWEITSPNPQIESLAIREFNRATHSPPIFVDLSRGGWTQ